MERFLLTVISYRLGEPEFDPSRQIGGGYFEETVMTVSNGPRPSSKGAGGKGTGRKGATKFTPQAVQKIKELVAQGVSRDEIANQLDVTLGSLQVTCSRLGISLRRNQNGLACYTLDGRGRTIPARGSVDLHVHKTGEVSQAAAHDAPLAKCALTMGHQGKELATNIPLTSRAIEGLALEATFQDLGITQLLGQMLVAAIKKDIIDEILRDEVPPSDA